jgi:hypothetical protein
MRPDDILQHIISPEHAVEIAALYAAGVYNVQRPPVGAHLSNVTLPYPPDRQAQAPRHAAARAAVCVGRSRGVDEAIMSDPKRAKCPNCGGKLAYIGTEVREFPTGAWTCDIYACVDCDDYDEAFNCVDPFQDLYEGDDQ